MDKQTTYIILAAVAGFIIAWLYFRKKDEAGTVPATDGATSKTPPNSPGNVQCLTEPC